MYTIYKIVDGEKGIIYVGSTVQKLKKRLTDHLAGNTKATALYLKNANRKDVNIYPICHRLTKSEAIEHEEFWTEYLSKKYDLLNIDIGNKRSNAMKKQVSEKLTNMTYNRTGVKCIETGEAFCTIRKASEKYKIDHSNISACLAGRHKTAGGYHWVYN